MKTIIEKINPESFTVAQLKTAIMVLRKGGLVAFPTETVYGLGGNALDADVAEKIYKAKGRPSDNPLIVHIADLEAVEVLATDISLKVKQLADAFWPGPLTIVLKKSEKVPYGTTGGLDTVALRMPSHKLARELIRESGIYIAAPSANTSGRPSPTLAEHVIEDLEGKIDVILDGGMVGIGLESTIVDLSEGTPVILRPGSITKVMLEKVVGEVELDKAVFSEKQEKNLEAKAPGMKYKHYAPKGDLFIFEGELKKVADAINASVDEKVKAGYKVGIIATDETATYYPEGIIKCIGSRKDESTIAKKLYSILREFDALDVDYIFSESFKSDDLGIAIMNRLLKAAGYQKIIV